MRGSKILWLSRFKATESQQRVLRAMFGEDVNVEQGDPTVAPRAMYRHFLSGQFDDWVVFLKSNTETFELLRIAADHHWPLTPLAEPCKSEQAEWWVDDVPHRFSRFARLALPGAFTTMELGETARAVAPHRLLMVGRGLTPTPLDWLKREFGGCVMTFFPHIVPASVARQLAEEEFDDVVVLRGADYVRELIELGVRPIVQRFTAEPQLWTADMAKNGHPRWFREFVRVIGVSDSGVYTSDPLGIKSSWRP